MESNSDGKQKSTQPLFKDSLSTFYVPNSRLTKKTPNVICFLKVFTVQAVRARCSVWKGPTWKLRLSVCQTLKEKDESAKV